MATKARKPKITATDPPELYHFVSEVADSAEQEPGYMFTAAALHAEALKLGFVETSQEINNQAGEIATAITQAGLNFINTYIRASASERKKIMSEINETVETVETEQANPDVIGVIKNMPIPEILSGKNGRKEKYPFSQLEPGDCFFLADEPGAPAIVRAKQIARNARAKFAVPTGAEHTTATGKVRKEYTSPKTFVAAEGDHKGQHGAFVWRKT